MIRVTLAMVTKGLSQLRGWLGSGFHVYGLGTQASRASRLWPWGRTQHEQIPFFKSVGLALSFALE